MNGELAKSKKTRVDEWRSKSVICQRNSFDINVKLKAACGIHSVRAVSWESLDLNGIRPNFEQSLTDTWTAFIDEVEGIVNRLKICRTSYRA